jgi:hypothetical protein
MKKLLPLIVFVLMFSAGYSQSLPIWTKTTAEKLSVLEKADRSSMPQKIPDLSFGFFRIEITTANGSFKGDR